jgi:FkbM family methyltransferase
MNWKLLIGRATAKIDEKLIRSNIGFIKNNYPYRRNFIFDLSRVISTPTVIFDVGAYNGDVSIELNQNFNKAIIYSFEPVANSFALLKQATGAIENIHCYQLAAGEKMETVEIPVFEQATINTLKSAEQYGLTPLAREKIRVVRLDEFASANNIGHIDILKIDVEGYEFEVLRGAGDLLKHIDYIVVEVGYIRCPTKTHFSDMETFMEQNGFEVFNVYELMPFYNDRTRLCYSNVVYIRKWIGQKVN